MKTKITVLGAGSWGTALAMLLARNGHDVVLWSNDAVQISGMKALRCNTIYLPDITFPENLELSSELAESVKDATDVLLVVPSHAYSSFLPKLKPLLNADMRIASASKGFCENRCLHDVMLEQFGERPLAIISGPSFAKEVAQGLPTAVVVASSNESYAKTWINYLNSDNFRPYQSSDVVGVEIGGAVKNVLAIATGIASGMKLGSNAQAAIITRGLTEITRLGLAMGAQAETFTGLAGIGDLVLTATDNQSRNRRFGFALGQGKTIQQAKDDISQVIEGISTTQEVYNLAREYNVEMPITEQVYQILYQQADVKEAVQKLLSRNLKAE